MKTDVSKRYHVIIDGWNVDKKELSDKVLLEKAIKNIASLCEMNILYGPIVIEGILENPGLTGFAIIDYSHISIHTFSKDQDICTDVFSCKPFDYNKVKDYIITTFGLDKNHIKTIDVKYPGER
jgi:S-adenosylmethionine decarboxylase